MSKDNLLNHLAIIMDGNGRWAKNRGLNRSAGHERGAKVVRDITEHVSKNTNIKYLTLYAFSTENWNRPKLEVQFLMKLLKTWIEKEKETFIANNVSFKAIGDISAFSSSLQEALYACEKATSHCDGLRQFLALNYGSRDEIIRAVNKINKPQISIEDINANLDTAEAKDVDLLIRVGGERRLSNFLLWQASYAELYFSDTLFPDFTCEELDAILEEFKAKHRRFGGL